MVTSSRWDLAWSGLLISGLLVAVLQVGCVGEILDEDIACAEGEEDCPPPDEDFPDPSDDDGSWVEEAIALPIHGVDTYWTYPHRGFVTRVDQRVRIDDEAPYMYWAHTAWFGNGSAMYMGVQTNATLPDGTKGKMGIFSLWNANGVSGAYCINFSGEGSGKSCRIKYPFIRGRDYVFSMQYYSEDAGGIWWRAQIIDGATWQTSTIGIIRAPKGYGLIADSASFSEVWGGSYATCQNITFSQAVFWRPVSWALFQPGTYTASHNYTSTNGCAKGKGFFYGAPIVHQMGW